MMSKGISNSGVIIYDKKVNRFVRKYFIANNQFSNYYLAKNILQDSKEIEKYICLLFLYYDTVCFDVYGENIIIPYLVHMFGQRGLENLIEQGAIKFLLSTTIITHSVTPIKGLYPLQSGEFSTEAHKNPEDSITSGFNFMIDKLDRKSRRDLTKKIIKVYNTHPKGVSSRIVDSVFQGYKDNLFNTLGLPCDKDLGDFSVQDNKKIFKIAEYYLDLSLMSYYKYSSVDTYPLELLNAEQIKHLKKTEKIKEYTNKTFSFEKIPNFEMLIDSGKLKIEDIPEFRKKKSAINFRKWIASLSNADFESFDVKEYLDSIDASKTFWQTNSGRLLRTMSVSIVSAAWSMATHDPVAGSCALSLLDEFYLDSLLNNWSPRFFFKETVNYLENQE